MATHNKGITVYSKNSILKFNEYSGFKNLWVRSMMIDENNRAWLCLQHGGLIVINHPFSKNPKINWIYGTKDHPELSFNSIDTDLDGNVWVSVKRIWIVENFGFNYVSTNRGRKLIQ